jgi:hypothetical protein
MHLQLVGTTLVVRKSGVEAGTWRGGGGGDRRRVSHSIGPPRSFALRPSDHDRVRSG